MLPARPSVTIAIPVLNEARNLPDLFDFLLREDYPNITSILFALAPSTDASEDLLLHFAEVDTRVKILDNPEKTVAIGLNRCIDETQTDYFVRLDAHTRYGKGYIEKLVNAAEQSGALNTGGVQQFRVENSIQFATALLLTLVSDVGLNRWRNPKVTGFTDTVYLGCYRTDVLKNIGGFSEDQLTNQDAELNQRLNNIQKNGVYQDGSIISWYAPRETIGEIARQYYSYGQGRALNWITHWPKIPVRSVLPPVALFGILFLLFSVPEIPALMVALLLFVGFFRSTTAKTGFWMENNQISTPLAILEMVVVLTVVLCTFSAGLFNKLWEERGEIRIQPARSNMFDGE